MENKEISTENVTEKETFVECPQATDEGGIPVSDEEDNDLLESDQMQTNEMASDEVQSVTLSTTINTIDEMSIAGEISKYIQSNRINLGELENSIDMWAICDAISAAHSGLPDSLLREAFLLVLEGSYAFAQNNPWMRKHIDQLTRIWKREMLSEKSTNRPTKFVSSSAEIEPQKEAPEESVHPTENAAPHSPIPPVTEPKGNEHPQKEQGQVDAEALPTSDPPADFKSRRQRRQAAKRKRALAVMMGVGQMLKQARRTMDTETGQLDVDEDEFGNFTIGGTELTFESWGKLNAITQSEVVHIGERQQQMVPKEQQKSGEEGGANKQQNGGHFQAEEKAMGHKTEKLRRSVKDNSIASSTAGHLRHRTNENKKAANALLEGMAQRFPTVAEVEMPSQNDDEQRPVAASKVSLKKGRKAAKMKRKQKRLEEKDEGELSSSDSEEPTSSEEEEEAANSADEAAAPKKSGARLVASRERRRTRRVDEQKQGVSSAQNLQALLRKCFELRTRIVGKLSIGQKAMFRDYLNKSISGALQHQSQQSQLQQLVHSAANPATDANGDPCPTMPNL
ncbi:hypothetical protein niasHS_010705 [Heterodera schachtii]|uniref:Uncharacterized protein n=1 Tax=Heterodera schachtii TaxID=97005 RepID=A0ABD2ITI7_HETSC